MSKYRILSFGLLLAMMAAYGCGPNKNTVSGTVTFNSKNLRGGNVVFYADSGSRSFSGAINEDGTYSVTGINSGEYVVIVETSSLKPEMKKGPAYMTKYKKDGDLSKFKNEPPKGVELKEGYKMGNPFEASNANRIKNFVPIPSKYEKKEDTPLKFKVVSGDNKFDITLSE